MRTKIKTLNLYSAYIIEHTDLKLDKMILVCDGTFLVPRKPKELFYYSGNRQARHAYILQIGLHFALSRSMRSAPVMVQPLGFRQDRIRWAGSSIGNRATCPWKRSWRSRAIQVPCSKLRIPKCRDHFYTSKESVEISLLSRSSFHASVQS